MLHRLWLLFAQVCTICVAALFTVSTLRPEWFVRSPAATAPMPPITVVTAPSTPEAGAKISSAQISFSHAAATATPSVVKIGTSAERRRFRPQALDDPLFERFFGRDRQGSGPQILGEGSGVIVRADGFILTNNHVLEGAQQIRVELADKRVLPARLIGTDPETDLAVIKVETPEPLPAITFGDSASLKPGDIVLAIGNPFGVFGNTVTMGIVSATGRTALSEGSPFENFIQTDAAINQGNSGGALVNLNGHLIGINTSIFTRTGDFSGIGFAIPTAIALPVMEQLIATGQVQRGFLGATLGPLTPDAMRQLGLASERGALVAAVLDGGPGARGGLRPNDVIVEVNGKAVEDRIEAINLIAMSSPGSSIPIKVLRNGETHEIKVTLGARPRPKKT